VVLAALVGASLALAGAAFQGMLRNSLADPYIVGTSSGAAFGAALAIVLGLSSGFDAAWPLRPMFAFVGALLTMGFVFALSRVDGRLPVDTFLLAGVVVGSFLWAFVSFILAISQGKMREIVFWLMGDLSLASWPMINMMAPYFVVGSVALFMLSHRMNLLTVGEESAAALGVEVEKTKILIVVFASLLTAAAVSVSGLIGFLGLMVPHLVRSAWGPDHRILLPASALGGAAFLIVADTAARLLGPAEIPVGVLTALFGGPFFFVILRRKLAV
jgi:iron complex transport system permease protein